MDKPRPINLKTDAEFKALNWGAVVRDADGHALCLQSDLVPNWRQDAIDAAKEMGGTVTWLKDDDNG